MEYISGSNVCCEDGHVKDNEVFHDSAETDNSGTTILSVTEEDISKS